MAGVNDSSTKHGYRDISPVYCNRYTLPRELIHSYYKARILLDVSGNSVVICDLINFQLHNIRDAPFLMQQEELNARVILLNQYIRYMNAERQLYGPNMAEYTHKQGETDTQVSTYHKRRYSSMECVLFENRGQTGYQHVTVVGTMVRH